MGRGIKGNGGCLTFAFECTNLTAVGHAPNSQEQKPPFVNSDGQLSKPCNCFCCLKKTIQPNRTLPKSSSTFNSVELRKKTQELSFEILLWEAFPLRQHPVVISLNIQMSTLEKRYHLLSTDENNILDELQNIYLYSGGKFLNGQILPKKSTSWDLLRLEFGLFCHLPLI